MYNYSHQTVLLKESIASLKIKKNGIYLDGTFGGGGHSINILKNLGKNGKLYAIDRDPISIKIAKKISDPRFHIFHGNFSNIDIFFKKYNISDKIDGVILDLGMSNMQIKSHSRGFSFKYDSPLDMRMNPSIGITASEWINKSNQKTIVDVLKYFGEEKFALKIARSIQNYKKIKPIKTTQELSNIIKSVVPKNFYKKHSSTKSFQAIRILINNELEEIKIFLNKILKILNKNSRISVISFHSLEDRIVKNFIMKNSKRPIIPNRIPISEEQINNLKKIKLKFISKIFPSIQEIIKNPQSRSAILRTAEVL